MEHMSKEAVENEEKYNQKMKTMHDRKARE